MIEMGKKYKTHNGLSVRILATDIENNFPVCAALKTNKNEEILLRYKNDGRYCDQYQSGYDLIEVTPYDDFKEDDLCVVWDDDSKIKKFRYFSHEKSSIAWCFNTGGTSYTRNSITDWTNCRKATEEEIKTKTIKD